MSAAQNKDLKEPQQHGTSVFPLAAYRHADDHYEHRVVLHWHPEVEIVRFVSGTFTYALDAGEPVTISAPAILLIPGNVVHTFTLPAGTVEEAVVFDLSMLVLEHYDELQSDLFRGLSQGYIPLPVPLTPEHPSYAEAEALLSYVTAHAQDDDAAQRLVVKAKLLELLSTLYAQGVISKKELKTTVKRQAKRDNLRDILSYIDEHYTGPLSVVDAARRMDVTVQYFCRFFKKVTGMSFTEYLNDLRLRRAAYALSQSDAPISVIAAENGFESAGYFFKGFKQKFNITPLQYRKKLRREAKAAADAAALAAKLSRNRKRIRISQDLNPENNSGCVSDVIVRD